MPLDNQQGTGILNLQRVYAMYSAGQQMNGAASVPGYDFITIFGTNAPGTNILGSTNGVVSYRLGSPAGASADLDVTLAWDRHTFWTDVNGNGRIVAGDTFYVNPSDVQDNLDLVLYRNGAVVAQSRSTLDTIEHMHLTGLAPGAYQLNVERLNVPNSGNSEPFGLAWYSTVAWTNLPPAVRFTGVGAPVGGNVILHFQLTSGQAGGFELQTATNLNHAVWTAVTGAIWTQTGSNTFQIQQPVGTGQRFFRIKPMP